MTLFTISSDYNVGPKKIWRILALVSVLLVFTGVPAALHAQDQQPAPQQQAQPHNRREPGFARQLTHETREAAGEGKDETEEFKKSPSVQFIAHITGLSIPHAYMLSVFFNFGVVALIIIWALGKYLPRVFNARTAAIQKAMQEAQKASEEARRKLAEIESRLKKLDVEIGMMRDAAEREAADEEARIHAAAEEDKRKILEAAQHEISAATKSARRELTAYAADLAVGLAKKQIRVDAATDQALVRNFAGELGSNSGASKTDGPGKARS
jgi:F-type H+-transporting ATPase subunit b